MKVLIKSFGIGMEVKKSGIEFEVRTSKEHMGDCCLTSTGLEWCKGRTRQGGGVKMTWQEFIDICASKASLSRAVKSAKKTP